MAGPSVSDRVHGSAPLRRRQFAARMLTAASCRLEIRGLQHIPAHGPVLLAVNHSAFLDGPLMFGAVRRPVTFLVKEEAFTSRMAPVLHGAGQLPVARDRVDAAPVRACLRILRAGGVVGMFPEGTRGDGSARAIKPGVGYLALRSGASVVPVACHGSAAVARRWTRPRVSIVVGRPLRVPAVPVHRRLRRGEVRDQAELIRRELAQLVRDTR